MKDILKNPWVRLLLALLAAALFLRLLWGLREALTPFAIALALAYFLNPVVNGLESVIATRMPWLARRVVILWCYWRRPFLRHFRAHFFA